MQGTVVSDQIEQTDSEVLTITEAAEYLRCHPKTLRKMAIKKEIPAKRVGYLWRFSRIRLQEWMQTAA
ncbi:MAG: helix-turn-helix domain-containing protein [Terracidiphilus sp.]